MYSAPLSNFFSILHNDRNFLFFLQTNISIERKIYSEIESIFDSREIRIDFFFFFFSPPSFIPSSPFVSRIDNTGKSSLSLFQREVTIGVALMRGGSRMRILFLEAVDDT